jgi:hypothetical protein
MALSEFRPTEITDVSLLREQFVHYCEHDWRIVVDQKQIKAMEFEVYNKVGLKLYLNDLQRDIDERLRYAYDPDGTYIELCKQYAKLMKVPYQYLLSKFRPSGVLNRPVWNEIGDIVPWEKMFR